MPITPEQRQQMADDLATAEKQVTTLELQIRAITGEDTPNLVDAMLAIRTVVDVLISTDPDLKLAYNLRFAQNKALTLADTLVLARQALLRQGANGSPASRLLKPPGT